VSAGDAALTVPIHLAGGEEAAGWYRPRAGGVGEIRVRLSRRTAAGTYDATAVFPDGQRPIVLQVDAYSRVRFHPRVLSVDGEPDGSVTATVTALNEGNGSIDIPKTGGAGLYEQGALECALGRALRAERPDGQRFIDRVADEFAGEFGGTLRLSLKNGAGILNADSARELTVVMHCPSGLKPGKRYDGTWNFDGGSLAIAVQTKGQS
jgi:hypothetical protein